MATGPVSRGVTLEAAAIGAPIGGAGAGPGGASSMRVDGSASSHVAATRERADAASSQELVFSRRVSRPETPSNEISASTVSDGGETMNWTRSVVRASSTKRTGRRVRFATASSTSALVHPSAARSDALSTWTSRDSWGLAAPREEAMRHARCTAPTIAPRTPSRRPRDAADGDPSMRAIPDS